MTEKTKLTLSVVDTIEVMNNNEAKYDADWTLGSVISDSVINDVGIVCVEKGVGSLICDDVGIVLEENGVCTGMYNDGDIV